MRAGFTVGDESHNLVAHADVLHIMLEKYNETIHTNVTLNSDEGDIYLAVLSLPPFTVSYKKGAHQ